MRLKTSLLVIAAFTMPCSAIFAAPIPPSQVTQIVSFGDSLSDAGNASIATLGAQPPAGYATRTVPGVPFPVGYFTNPQSGGGPSGLWVDQLAVKLGVPDPTPALAGGTNYAVGSADTGITNPQDMGIQVADFLAANGTSMPSGALYTFWGGANDIADFQNPVAAADNIAAEISAIAAAGGQNFLWLNLPDLGQIPELSGTPGAALATLASEAFDAEWANDLIALNTQGINVIGVDVGSLFSDIQTNPSTYGLNNVTTACDTTVGCDPNKALFWDDEHPTTEGHELVADLALDTAFTPVPEPSTFVLLGTGVLGLAGTIRRRISKR